MFGGDLMIERNNSMTYSLLIVEDDPEMRELLSARFERNGCVVTTAATIAEALQAAAAREFDVALLDRRLSEESGLELMLELKSRKAGLQAIVLSGYADPEFEEEALELGAFAYLRKPCRLAEIESAVHRAVAAGGVTEPSRT